MCYLLPLEVSEAGQLAGQVLVVGVRAGGAPRPCFYLWGKCMWIFPWDPCGWDKKRERPGHCLLLSSRKRKALPWCRSPWLTYFWPCKGSSIGEWGARCSSAYIMAKGWAGRTEEANLKAVVRGKTSSCFIFVLHLAQGSGKIYTKMVPWVHLWVVRGQVHLNAFMIFSIFQNFQNKTPALFFFFKTCALL